MEVGNASFTETLDSFPAQQEMTVGKVEFGQTIENPSVQEFSKNEGLVGLPKLPVSVVKLNPDLPDPAYETVGSAGFDLRANIATEVYLQVGQRMLIPTGLKVAIPIGFELQVRPRSGSAYKAGITVLNSPGTIDSDYRGEVGVLLINHSEQAFKISSMDRIAQGVVAPIIQARFNMVEELPTTARGEGGFGSTGTK